MIRRWRICCGALCAAMGLLTSFEAFSQSVNLSNRFSLAFKSSHRARAPIKLGDFNARLSGSTGVGFDDNPFEEDPAVETGFFNRTGASGSLTSDWEKHLFRVSAGGVADFFPGVDGGDEIFANAGAFGRLDLADETKLELKAGYGLERDPRDNKSVFVNPVTNPKEQKLTGAAIFTQGFGDLAVTSSVGFFRLFDEDVPTNGGGVLLRTDKNHNRYDFNTRFSFNKSKKLNVFAEGGYNFRDYDNDIDRNGIARGANGFHVAAGTVFQLSDTVSGEFAIGSRSVFFDDPRFSNLTTVTFDGYLTWAVTEDFNLTVIADTIFKEQPVSDRGGVLERIFEAQADYYWTDEIRTYVNARYRFDDNVSNDIDDHFFNIKTGIDYEMKPGVVAGLQYQHRALDDGNDVNDYRSNSVLLNVSFSL